MNLNILIAIYKKYNPKSKPDGDSQICLLWSTKVPPEILGYTDQIIDIEEKFDVELSEDVAVEMYDMNLLEASYFLEKLKLHQMI